VVKLANTLLIEKRASCIVYNIWHLQSFVQMSKEVLVPYENLVQTFTSCMSVTKQFWSVVYIANWAKAASLSWKLDRNLD